MKKYLILTVTAGNGHNSAAKHLEQRILSENKGDQVKIVDVFKEYGNKLKVWTMNEGYFFLVKYLVKGYNFVFKRLEKLDPNKRNKATAQQNILPESPHILKLIYEYKPDIIYCTHFAPAIAITNLRKHYEIPAKVFAPVLDYDLSPYWECTIGIDYIVSSCDDSAKNLPSKGFNKNQILNYGITVSPKFSLDLNKEDTRKKLGLKENMFTLLIMKASFFTIKNKELLRQLEKVNVPMQIVIVNGNSYKDKAYFDKKINKLNSKHTYVNLGFVTNMDELYSASDLAVCKGGGLTTTECLNKRLPNIIVNKLPLQEIHNKEYVLNKGCSLNLQNNKNLHTIINIFASNPKKLEEFKQKIDEVRKPDALENLYQFMGTCPNADYKEYTNNIINNKEVIKQIKKSLKKKD